MRSVLFRIAYSIVTGKLSINACIFMYVVKYMPRPREASTAAEPKCDIWNLVAPRDSYTLLLAILKL